nr:uncharacterized protein LOC109176597 [Ipomoea batatas]
MIVLLAICNSISLTLNMNLRTDRLQGADRMDRDIVSALIQLMSGNLYGQFFRSLKDIAQTDEFSIILRSNISMDQRTYNMPSASQVAAIWIEDNGDGLDGNRNIRVHAHSGRSQYIQYYYGCYDPLQYPLLFPHGDIGWHEGIQRVSSREHVGTTGSRQSANINPNNINSIDELIQAEECVFTEGRKRASVSCIEYYAYKFQVRLGDKSMLLHTGRLLQQFIIDTYIKIETQRLDYFRKKQQQSCSETYQGLVYSVETGATVGADVGSRVILPVSFIGGPRDMRRRYMDAMSLVQRFGKPDLFITVTCNPNWPEIKELLKYVDEPQNRPDLLARVFHARLEELKNDIFKRHIFGEVAAYAYVIEFQKMGLPHAHFLIILKSKFKITTSAHCDRFISAEIPNKETEPHVYNLVKKHNVRTPKSFDNIKTVNGNQAVTFREAAKNLGLLSGDHIVEKCLDETVLY